MPLVPAVVVVARYAARGAWLAVSERVLVAAVLRLWVVVELDHLAVDHIRLKKLILGESV
ncbi:hypothetical protein BKG69_06090 [Mycobacteroides chelonae]|nr:hypothetical protein BKG69_06090 [Mycobacteroides chelonae]